MKQTAQPDTKPEFRWGVVSTMREPLPLTIAFVCYHLALGASAIYVFLDDPNDPAAKLLSKLPNTYVTFCGPRYWRKRHGIKRPERNTRRQAINANLALRRTRRRGNLDALLHMDADEFLHLPEPLEKEWARLTPEQMWLSIPNHERVWLDPPNAGTLFSGQFRAPMFKQPALIKKVYGKFEQFLAGGLAGHSAGKALSRVTPGAFMAIHKVKDGGPAGDVLPYRVADTARILHFNGMTPRNWTLKTLRFLGKDQAELKQRIPRIMIRRVNWILGHDDPVKAAMTLHEKLFCLSPEQADDLRDAGGLFEAEINPRDAMQTYLGADAPSLNVVDYDTDEAKE